MKRMFLLVLAGLLVLSSTGALAADIRREGLVQEDRVRAEPVDDRFVNIDDDETPLAGPDAPYVNVTYSFGRGAGAQSVVTLKAEVKNLARGRVIQYQWQNNATGEFRDVPGAVGPTFSYILDEDYSAQCGWRVNVLAMR